MNQTLIRFTEAPELAAAVRLDLQAAPAKVGATGLSVGAPALQSEADSPTASWGNRRLTLTQYVEGSKADARPVMAALARELLRARNWLLVRFSPASTPVWFHTYRTQPGEIDLEQVYDSESKRDVWQIQVQLEADPWAYGELVTMPAQTVPGSPARFVLPTVRGDAPSPAVIALRTEASPSGKRHLVVANTRPHVTSEIGTGDVWEPGADVDAGSVDAAYSGSSYRAVSFATTSGMSERIFTFHDEDLLLVPGRYKVLLRCARPATAGTFALRFRVSNGAGYLNGETVTADWGTSPGTHHAWVDLGDFDLPPGGSLVPEGNPLAEQLTIVQVSLEAQRLTGTAALHLDALEFVPVREETRMLVADFATDGPAGGLAYDRWLNGDAEASYTTTVTDGSLTLCQVPLLAGGFPLLHPGEENRLTIFDQTSTTRAQTPAGYATSDGLGDDVRVEVSYHPRYIWLGWD